MNTLTHNPKQSKYQSVKQLPNQSGGMVSLATPVKFKKHHFTNSYTELYRQDLLWNQMRKTKKKSFARKRFKAQKRASPN